MTEAEGSLAQYISHTSKRHSHSSSNTGASGDQKSQQSDVTNVPGVFKPSDASRLSILNGSHHTISCDDDKESVLVFPDYKVVKDVERTQDGADLLWRMALDPNLNRAGRGVEGARSWPLPYACVILLCAFAFSSRLVSRLMVDQAPTRDGTIAVTLRHLNSRQVSNVVASQHCLY